jgi:formylglycine-generating enzyme required for sulfatase activity
MNVPIVVAAIVSVLVHGPCASQTSSTQTGESRDAESRPASRRTTSGVGYTVVQAAPKPGEVIETALAPIAKTGLPWKIRLSDVDLVLVLVPPGQGTVGAVATDTRVSKYSDEQPECKITVERPFWIGEAEVTNAQFRVFDPTLGRLFLNELTTDEPVSIGEPNQPVTAVSWERARAFCDRFSVRLPTEIEWEYACRFTTRTIFTWGDREEDGASHENLLDIRGMRIVDRKGGSSGDDGFAVTAPACSLRRNVLGLCDMGGNVQEWCSDDYYQDRYRSSSLTDVHSPYVGKPRTARVTRVTSRGEEDQYTTEKVLRGGDWASGAWQARISKRGKFPAVVGDATVGFRIVLDP